MIDTIIPNLLSFPQNRNLKGVRAGGKSIIDQTSLLSENSFAIYNDSFTGDQSFTSTSYANVSGLQIDIKIFRPTKIIFFLSVEAAQEQSNSSIDMAGRIEYRVNIDGNYQNPPIFIDTGVSAATSNTENTFRKTYFTSIAQTLNANDFGSGIYPVTIPTNVAYRAVTNTNMIAHFYSVFLTALVSGDVL